LRISLCELLIRLRSVGLAGHDAYELPVTQADLGDAFGISTVHVNRMLQKPDRTPTGWAGPP
jgi:DNA-binding transcriptional regulator LsrR (DeoR family)